MAKEKMKLGIILILAAFLRLWQIADFMEFLGDQGRDLIIVRRFLTKGDLMFIGPQTSIGNMYLGPWYYYLIAPALWLARFSPVGPAILVALLGVATVFLAWWVGQEWFGKKVGFLAALFLATSPVVVYYSIFSWNPNVMPFFALLSAWLAWRVWQKNEVNKFPWLAVSLAMVLNSHYLGLLLFAVVNLLVLDWLRKNFSFLSLRKILISYILIFLLLMLPLVLFDVKHNFVNARAFWRFFTVRQTTVNFKVYKGLVKLPAVFNQLFAQFLLRQEANRWVYWLLPLLVFGVWRQRQKRATWWLLFWVVVGLLGLSNYKQHIYAHYFGFLYPAAALLLALGVGSLSGWVRWIVGAGMAAVMLAHWHGWQPPPFHLQRAKRVAEFIAQQSGGEKFALALIAKRNYDTPYRYFLVLRGAPLVDLHREVPDQLFVICKPWGGVDCNPIGHPQWEIAAFGWASVDRQWEVEGVKVFRLVHFDKAK